MKLYLRKATPAEKWAYFLLHAEHMTMEEIRELFPEPEFIEAAGVLEVIKNNPDQMSDYISRLKYQKDENWRIEASRMEGRAEGRVEGRVEGRAEGRVEGEKAGELIGRILSLHEILGLTIPSREELSTYNAPKLSNLLEQLRAQARTRQP